jgi:hypothetical protein
MAKALTFRRQPPRLSAPRAPDSGSPAADGNPAKEIVRPRNSSDGANIHTLPREPADTVVQAPYLIHRGKSRVIPNLKKWQRGHRLRNLTRGHVKNGRAQKNKTAIIGGNKKNNPKVSKPSQTSPFTVEAPIISPASTDHVRAKRQVVLSLERQERHKLVKEYNIIGDTRVFAPFLEPFMRSSKLSEWHWDDEVELWWREDKATGARVWEPVDESFL